MNKLNKTLDYVLVTFIVLTILFFVASIIVGYATDFSFFFSFQDPSESVLTTLTNSNIA